jgi:hypothetical protein
MIETGVINLKGDSKVALVFGQMNEPPFFHFSQICARCTPLLMNMKQLAAATWFVFLLFLFIC